MRIKKDEREQATILRRLGWTYGEIAAKLGVAKSSLTYWGISGISVSVEAQNRLDGKSREAGLKSNKILREKYSTIELHKLRVQAGKKAQLLHGHRLYRLTQADREKANLTYRKDEVPVAEMAVKITGLAVTKEKVGRDYCDLCSTAFIAEHTVDWTRGVGEAIERLIRCSFDPRIKILITHVTSLLPVYRDRLDGTGIRLLDIADFWAGRWV